MRQNQKWDYPAMARCATRLDELCEASIRNKKLMDDAFETLATGAQAEVGRAFQTAYSEHVSSIKMFAQAMHDEAEMLRVNKNSMQEADREIANQIRLMFNS